LYNLTDGGEGVSGYVPSEEARRKMSEARRGENNYFYGKSLSGKDNGRWKDKSHLTDEIIFQYLQSCISWQEELPLEWGVGETALRPMFEERYGTEYVVKVQSILAKDLGFKVLNNINFIEYCETYSSEFLQKANDIFGISAEQLQRWCLRKYKAAKTQTIKGWLQRARTQERSRRWYIKKSSQQQPPKNGVEICILAK
jgi:hypothetical protein